MKTDVRVCVFWALAAVGIVVQAKADPSITEVVARQRYPWNGKVDISYAVSGVDEACLARGLIPSLRVLAIDRTTHVTNVAAEAHLSGDTALADGRHAFVWDMDAQGLRLVSTNVSFVVSYEASGARYCIIDLSEGAAAEAYPVAYTNAVPTGDGLWSDEYKTTKLVLRRCPAGTDPLNRYRLTKDFYAGVFELTQAQWILVEGSNPSHFSVSTDPADTMSYEQIRGAVSGALWPASAEVDADSLVGRLRARTGFGTLDLPTEAQWEYACRAGTATTFSYGNTASSDHMWYVANSLAITHSVGLKLPNPWGLYDMHGNALEWCVDWCDDPVTRKESAFPAGGAMEAETGLMLDPLGEPSGYDRCTRGGSIGNVSGRCSSSACHNNSPWEGDRNTGLRLFRTMGEAWTDGTRLCEGASEATRLDLRMGTRVISVGETPTLAYSTGWGGGETVVVRDDGEILLSTNGTGTLVWVPSAQGGVHVLTHTVVREDETEEEMTARFRVPTAIVAEPAPVEHAVTVVYMDGVAAAETPPGSGRWLVGSNETAYVVYTAEAGYCFTDGSRVVTNWLDTASNPATNAAPPSVMDHPTFSGVTARQRYPWNGKVDIAYTLSDLDAFVRIWGQEVSLAVLAIDRQTGRSYVAEAAYLAGDTAMTDGTHRFVWDMSGQGFTSLASTNVTFVVLGESASGTGTVPLCAGESEAAAVDLRPGVRTVVAGEPLALTYSSEWEVGETVAVAADGNVLVDTSGTGEVVWAPAYGSHTVTHTVTLANQETRVETATFWVAEPMFATPVPVDYTTCVVYTNGVASMDVPPNSERWAVWSNETAYVVYTAMENYFFADGSKAVTNAIDTSVSPAVNAEWPETPVLTLALGKASRAQIKDGVCTIVGTGSVGPYASPSSSALWDCRDEIGEVVITNGGITAVCANVFVGLHNLSNVVIGADVASVDLHAFDDCGALERVRFQSPETLRANGFLANITMDGEDPEVDTLLPIEIDNHVKRVQGKVRLEDEAWTYVTEETDRDYFFFRIVFEPNP